MPNLARGRSAGVTCNVDFPLFFEGDVIKGFGRGSKELGCPTANIPVTPYEELLENLPNGVYLGWAKIYAEASSKRQKAEFSSVYPMALNIGWSPFYKNKHKTIEVHLFHEFETDFYGAHLRAIAVDYIRPEADFHCVDDLIVAIQEDIQYSKECLKQAKYQQYQNHEFFTKPLYWTYPHQTTSDWSF